MIKILQEILIFLIPIAKFKIEGKSMEPKFKEGDVILINKLSYLFSKPQVKDIVAIKVGKIKSIIKKIKEIKGDKFFVIGENLKESKDSRHFGWVLKKDILGKVCFKI